MLRLTPRLLVALGAFALMAATLATAHGVAASDAGRTVAPLSPTQPIATLSLACTVTVQASNSSAAAIEVDLAASRVRTRNAPWKTLDAQDGACTSPTLALAPGSGERSQSCTLNLGCRKDRRYRFKLTHGRTVRWIEYPSETGWTQTSELDLGDLGRLVR